MLNLCYLGCGSLEGILTQSWIRARERGVSSSSRSMQNFKSFMDLAGVVDLPLHGMAFTWMNNRVVGAWARLDKFLYSPLFLTWFPSIVQKGLCRGL